MSRKRCQCGATPRFRVVRGMVRGRVRPTRRERLVCPACGNATSPLASRQALSREWESAAWCGQGEVAETAEGGEA